MNYKTKIELLAKKGLLNDDQAKRLSDSLQSDDKIATPQEPKRSPTLDIVGIVLLLLVITIVIFSLQGGAQTNTVQDVAKHLNTVGATGHIAAGYTLIWIASFGALVLYVLVYIVALRCANHLTVLREKIIQSRISLSQSSVIQKEAVPLLKKELERYLLHEKDIANQNSASTQTLTHRYQKVTELHSDTLVAFLMETIREFETDAKEQSETIHKVIGQYNSKLENAPCKLAGLVRDFTPYPYPITKELIG